MIKEAIKKVVGKEDLTYNEAYAVMNEIMSGETSAVENAAYLAALSTKSSGMETIAEISGSAAAMREHAERVEHDMEVIDIVGTGGDHSGSELGIRTVFNILGPLTNPSRPSYMLLGVYGEHLMRPLARVLPGLGVKRALIVHGTDGMDEISVGAPTLIHEISDGWERSYKIRPEDFGITPASKESIRGGKPEENAAVTRGILAGEITDARADVCLMNAKIVSRSLSKERDLYLSARMKKTSS